MFDKEIRFTLAGIIYLISLGIYIAGVIMNFNNNPQAKWLEMTYIVLCFLFTIFICFGCKKITKKINKRTTLPTFVFVLLIITYSIAIGLGFWNATDLLSATFKTIISVLFYVITLVANLLFFLLLCNTRYKLKM